MKHFGLGPNGAIMTSLNLFATKFDQVLTILGRRAEMLDYILIDTPGQIEAGGRGVTAFLFPGGTKGTFFR